MVRRRRKVKECRTGEVLMTVGRKQKCVKKRTAMKMLRKEFHKAQDAAFTGIDDMQGIIQEIDSLTTDRPGGFTSDEGELLLESIAKGVMHFEDLKGNLEDVEDSLGLPAEED